MDQWLGKDRHKSLVGICNHIVIQPMDEDGIDPYDLIATVQWDAPSFNLYYK